MLNRIIKAELKDVVIEAKDNNSGTSDLIMIECTAQIITKKVINDICDTLSDNREHMQELVEEILISSMGMDCDSRHFENMVKDIMNIRLMD